MSTLQKLQEKREALAVAMRAMIEAAEQDNNGEGRGFTDEESGKWDEMMKDLDSHDERIKHMQTVDDLEADLRAVESPMRRPQPGEAPGAAPEEEEQPFDLRYAGAFQRMIRSREAGLAGLSVEERGLFAEAEKRQQATSPGSAGGYLVPEDFGNRIIETMKAFGGLNTAATTFNTADGANLPFPTNDDTGNVGAILGENVEDSEQDLVFGQVTLGAYKYTSKIIRVSVELLQDSAFDLDAYIARKFGQRLGRATSDHFVNGTGTGQPNGILAASTSGKTTASGTAITHDEMLDLKHSVDPAYRVGGAGNWLFNDNTLKYLKQLKDSEGRPLWMPDIAGATPATFDGDAYVVDQAMPDIALNAEPVVYGDMSEYYIRNVKGFTMIRLVERYAEFHQVGFIAHLRTDGNLMDTAAVRKLTMAAA